MNRIVISSIFFFAFFFGYSQSAEGLWKTVNDTKNHDTVRLSALYDLAWEFIYSQPDSSFTIAQMQLEMAQKTKHKKWEAKAYNALGATYQVRSVFYKAIESYQKGLKIFQELGDKKNLAGALGNIGSIYINLYNYSKALEYQEQCLKLLQEIGNLEGIASSLNNISIIYTNLKDFDKALLYGEQSAEMYKLLKDDYGLASALANIGEVHRDMKNFEKAINFYNLALRLAQKNNFTDKIIRTKTDLADANYKLKKYELVIRDAGEAKALANKEEDIVAMNAANKLLSDAYFKTGKLKEAYDNLTEYMQLNDTISKLNNESEIIRLEAQMIYDKKAEEDSLRNARDQQTKDALIFAKNSQIEKDRIQKIALYGGIFLMIISGAVMYNRFRLIRKQKNIIELKSKETEEQKVIIEEKQKEILSSISYAKRLQEAILPPMSSIKAYLPDSFILYKPKDIVAGDFYWMEHTQDKVLIAAADCTGHGVPGAMVSVVCSNALNRTVKEFNISEPGKVLDKARELVVETFERSELEVKDGMDISLCLFDIKKRELQWAGANNPLWIVRKGEIIEFKPNKQAIGKVDNPTLYTTHTVQLQEGDCVYVFTDGYADQFGGPNGKKFKYNQLVELMKTMGGLPIAEQQSKLDTAFNNWKGPLEQVDDVCIIGIKV